MLMSAVGRRDHGVGQRPHRAVPRPRGAVARALRDGGQPAAPHREPGGGDEVLHAGRLLVGVPALRHRPRLRRHRVDQPRRRSSTSWTRTSCSRTGCCWPASRSCSSAWASRWRPSRSTPGRPTCTRARRRRSPGSWPRPRRRPAFAALLRVVVVGFASYENDWQPVIWVLAVITLLGGAVLAVVQTNVKRMLAYSSISHAGFILVGVEAAGRLGGNGDNRGTAAVLFYLLAYAVMVLGTFGVVTLVSRAHDGDQSLDGLPRPVPRPAGAGPGAHDLPARPGRGAPHDGLRGQVRGHRRRRRRARATCSPSSPCWRRSSPRSSTCGSS